MKTVVLIALVLVMPISAYADSSGWKTPWSENGLTTTDFKGSQKPLPENIHRSYDASSFISLYVDGTWDAEKMDGDVCKYKTTNQNFVAYILPYSSWAIDEVRQSDVWLDHEQKHFDIAQIFVNQLNEDQVYLCTNGQFNEKQIKFEMQKKYNKTLDDMQKLQDLYDLETNGGQYPFQQNLWGSKIIEWRTTGIEPVNDVWTDNLFYWMESSQITNQEFLFAFEYLVEKEILE